MNAQLAPEEIDTQGAPEGARALLRSVVITDLCDSTALVDRLGDVRATELIRAHDRLLRGLIREHRGQEIDKTDGFLSLFERPIQAVAFALAYQRGLRAFSLEQGVEISARIGLHVGEVMTWQNDESDVAKGAKPTEVEGLAKPVAARLMGMALPGQILLSGVAYTLAHRAEGELGAALSRVQWKAHGDFRFKGVAEAVPVYEIGEEGIAPFRAPAWSGKAHREVPLWRRPAMLAFEVIALIVALALPAWHFLKPEPAIAFAERDHVVLADLRNLTGDPRFDDSLEQALRIGLEQSRHVNVVSDLKLQRTLELMRLDPKATTVDRKIGSELAQRERATLLILPTLAELGGHLRLTVELVDPYSQVSVFSTSADAADSSQLVAGVDSTSLALRSALGERIEERPDLDVPLARATTANLDALRAYSIGVKALAEGRAADAESLFRRAVEMDEDFALARVGIAQSLRDQAKRNGAILELERALQSGDRLPVRERLLAEANHFMLMARGSDSLRAWRTASEIYPDSFPAHGGLAWTEWMYGLNLQMALKAAEVSASDANPFRATGVYLRATLLLALDEYARAQEVFDEARRLRPSTPNLYGIALHAAQNDWQRVDGLVRAAEQTSASPTARWYLLQFKAAIAIDRGDWAALEYESRALSALSDELGHRHKRGAAALALTKSALLDSQEDFDKAFAELRSEERSIDVKDPEAGTDRIYRLLLAANLAMGRGLSKEAAEILLEVGAYPELSSNPALASLYQAANANHLATIGRAEEAWQLLNSLPEEHSAHWLIAARAYVASVGARPDEREALFESAKRRGLAYTENRADRALLGYSLIQTRLAEAAITARTVRAEGSKARTGAWQSHPLPVGVAAMLKKLLPPADEQ